jgi:hypothetical protein
MRASRADDSLALVSHCRYETRGAGVVKRGSRTAEIRSAIQCLRERVNCAEGGALDDLEVGGQDDGLVDKPIANAR